MRELTSKLSDNITEYGGGLLIREVKLLANGQWTDSNVRTPLYYPNRALRAYAGNWTDTSVWSRHAHGDYRDESERIGTVLNPHYDDSAVIGDIFLHGANQESRDMITKVMDGDINYVSVEHTGEERQLDGRNEAHTLEFCGLALVPQGACKTCTIRSNSEANMTEEQTTPDYTAQIKELSEALAAKDSQIKELAEKIDNDTKIKELSDSFEGKLKELSEVLTAKDEQIAAIDKRIKELESQPATVAEDEPIRSTLNPFTTDAEGFIIPRGV
jgi:hypothetical protein